MPDVVSPPRPEPDPARQPGGPAHRRPGRPACGFDWCVLLSAAQTQPPTQRRV